MLKRVIVTASLILCSSLAVPATAQSNKELPAISAEGQAGVDLLMNRFFTTLQSGDAAKAYSDLFKGTLLEGKPLEVAQLVSQTALVTQTYGTILNWEVMHSECVTADYCRVSYFVRTQQAPIAFNSYLYRQPNGEWKPNYILMGTTPQFFFD